MPRFTDIVDEVTALEAEQMEEMRDIINKLLIEKKREQYLQQYKQALTDSKEGKLFSSNNIDEISKWLLEK